MLTDQENLEWSLKYERTRFIEHVERVVVSLRRHADDLERELRRTGPDFVTPLAYSDSFGPRDEYFREAHLGSNVVHTVTWMVANLNLDGLVDSSAKLKSIRDRLDWLEDKEKEEVG